MKTSRQSSFVRDGVTGYGRSAEKIKTDRQHKRTLQRVQKVMQDTASEESLRERLKEYHINLYLYRNDTEHITADLSAMLRDQ